MFLVIWESCKTRDGAARRVLCVSCVSEQGGSLSFFFFFFNKTNNKCVQERQKGPAVLILLTVVGPIMLFWS